MLFSNKLSYIAEVINKPLNLVLKAADDNKSFHQCMYVDGIKVYTRFNDSDGKTTYIIMDKDNQVDYYDFLLKFEVKQRQCLWYKNGVIERCKVIRVLEDLGADDIVTKVLVRSKSGEVSVAEVEYTLDKNGVKDDGKVYLCKYHMKVGA